MTKALISLCLWCSSHLPTELADGLRLEGVSLICLRLAPKFGSSAPNLVLDILTFFVYQIRLGYPLRKCIFNVRLPMKVCQANSTISCKNLSEVRFCFVICDRSYLVSLTTIFMKVLAP